MKLCVSSIRKIASFTNLWPLLFHSAPFPNQFKLLQIFFSHEPRFARARSWLWGTGSDMTHCDHALYQTFNAASVESNNMDWGSCSILVSLEIGELCSVDMQPVTVYCKMYCMYYEALIWNLILSFNNLFQFTFEMDLNPFWNCSMVFIHLICYYKGFWIAMTWVYHFTKTVAVACGYCIIQESSAMPKPETSWNIKTAVSKIKSLKL